MSRAAICIFLATAFSFEAYAQLIFRRPSPQDPTSPGSSSGLARDRFDFEGLSARSDGETLSVELRDQRVIRFRLDERTRYKPERPPENLTSFRMTDFVGVEAEVDAKGYLVARSVRFIRRASPEEQAEILQSPELLQPGRENVLDSGGVDLPGDDRRLNLVAKPKAIADGEEDITRSTEDEFVPLVRRMVDEASISCRTSEQNKSRASITAPLSRLSGFPTAWSPLKSHMKTTANHTATFASMANSR